MDAEIPWMPKDLKTVLSASMMTLVVVIGATSITEEQRAQIEDIVTRKTERNVSDIVITTME